MNKLSATYVFCATGIIAACGDATSEAMPESDPSDTATNVTLGPRTAYKQCGCAGGDETCCSIALTPAMPSASLLVPIVAPGDGRQNYTGIVVNATAFSSGALVVSGRVGSGISALSLDLFPSSAPYPTSGTPSNRIAWCYNNGPGSAFSMQHAFTEPTSFHLGAGGDWGTAAGETNTIEMTVQVTDEPPADKCAHQTSSKNGEGCTADADCGRCQRCERSTGNCVSRLSC